MSRFPQRTLEMMWVDLIGTAASVAGLIVSLWVLSVAQDAKEAAEAARSQAAIQVEKVKMQIASDIITARHNYEEASGRLTRYQTELLEKSRSVVESVSFAYQKGGASLVDLLTAQLNDNTTRQGAAQAQADQATAAATLNAAQQAVLPGELN